MSDWKSGMVTVVTLRTVVDSQTVVRGRLARSLPPARKGCSRQAEGQRLATRLANTRDGPASTAVQNGGLLRGKPEPPEV
jgi:hypothetical protein